MMYYEILDSLG